MRKMLILFALACSPGINAAADAASGDAVAKGAAIARSIVDSDKGWDNMTVTMLMQLKNATGSVAERTVSMRSLEVADDGDKSLLTFEKPLDVKGTRFLNYSHPIEADDQWMLMPSLNRVKRISSSNKSGPFMGSEFAYEDLASFEFEKYRYTYLRDVQFNGFDCEVIELFPNYKHSGYSKLVGWVDKERNVFHKIDFYDRKDSLLKTLTHKNYQQYLGKYWRPQEMVMVNHQNDKETTINWKGYRFRSNLDAADFSLRVLHNSF